MSRGLLDLLYPPRCMLCRKLLPDTEHDLCAACRRDLPTCEREQRGDFFDRCVSALRYTPEVRRAILRYKFHGRTSYAGPLGRLLADEIRASLAGKYELITWVPISPLRRLRRGYDQVELLAEAVAKELDAPLLRTLKKVKHNRSQSKMANAAARRANVLNVYRPRDPAAWKGKRILLLDDVVTTGATLSEAARVLKTAGAGKVVCATVAAVDKNMKTRKDR